MKYLVRFKGKFETDGVDMACDIAEKIAKQIKIQFLDECEVEHIKQIDKEKIIR